jgi:ribosomal protein S11
MLKQQKKLYKLKNNIAKLVIKCSFNNTIINMLIDNKMIICQACGNKTIKGAQRHSLYATQILLESIKFKLNEYNITQLKIYFKGITFKNYYIIKQLSNYKILKISNITNLPHNGCKLKKKKRR